MFYFSEVTMLKVALIASNLSVVKTLLQGNEAVRRVDAIVTELSKQLQLSNGMYGEHVISVSSHLVISLLLLSLQFFFLPLRHPLG